MKAILSGTLQVEMTCGIQNYHVLNVHVDFSHNEDGNDFASCYWFTSI